MSAANDNNEEEEVGGNAIIITQHNNEADDVMLCCASCGATEADDIKLKTCTACKSARYCSIKCQKEHRLQHKQACKKKAAELRDELLFKQPETTALGDCPICLLPLPLDLEKYKMQSCCSKIICIGCAHAHSSQRREECPFCRYPIQPEEDDEIIQNNTRRAEANDPIALQWMGSLRNAVGDYSSAFQYWTKAAELGEIISHFYLGLMYHLGNGVEKDEKKETYHIEQAAIGGHPEARFILGSDEWHYGSKERGTKHIVIAAKIGHDSAVKILREYVYAAGFISNEEFAEVLRAHQAALDAMKSPQREDAEKFKALMREWERREERGEQLSSP